MAMSPTSDIMDHPAVAYMISVIRSASATPDECRASILKAFNAWTTADIAESDCSSTALAPVYLLSFKEVQGVSDMETRILTFIPEENHSDTLKKNITKMANIAFAFRNQIKSPQDFSAVMKQKLFNGAFIRTTKVRNRIHELADQIEWNTVTGTPDINLPECDWATSPPTYTQRMIYTFEQLKKSMHGDTPTKFKSPVMADLPIFIRSSDAHSKWIKHIAGDQRRMSIPPTEIVASENLPTWLRDTKLIWSNLLQTQAMPGNISDKHCVYMLILEDPNAPAMWKYQSYAGSAAGTVKQRWFGAGGVSHLTAINDVITWAHHNTAQDPPRNTLLVDVLLAQIWLTQGTWDNHAMLFIIFTNRQGNEEKIQDDIIDTYKLTRAINGLNCKKSGRVAKTPDKIWGLDNVPPSPHDGQIHTRQ